MIDPDMKIIRRAYREATGKVGKRLTATDEKIIDMYILSRQMAVMFALLQSPHTVPLLHELTRFFQEAIADPWKIIESIELRDERGIGSDYQRFLIERFGRGDA